MPDLLVDVPDEWEELLKQRAERNGRTPEEEHRAILIDALERRSTKAAPPKSRR